MFHLFSFSALVHLPTIKPSSVARIARVVLVTAAARAVMPKYQVRQALAAGLLLAATLASAQSLTWVKGGNAPGERGFYGTLGAADAANTPGARQGSVSWADALGNVWLFVGLQLRQRSSDGAPG